MSNAELAAFVKKNPISIGSGVLSLLLAGAIYFFSGQVPEAETELGTKQAEGEKHAANLTNEKQLKEHYDALVAANKEIEHRLMRGSQTFANQQYFFKLEGETGTKLTAYNPGPVGPPKPKAAFTSVPFGVTVQGTLPQLLDFLHRIESGEHYCRVLTFQLSGSGADKNAALNLALNLELLGLP